MKKIIFLTLVLATLVLSGCIRTKQTAEQFHENCIASGGDPRVRDAVGCFCPGVVEPIYYDSSIIFVGCGRQQQTQAEVDANGNTIKQQLIDGTY